MQMFSSCFVTYEALSKLFYFFKLHCSICKRTIIRKIMKKISFPCIYEFLYAVATFCGSVALTVHFILKHCSIMILSGCLLTTLFLLLCARHRSPETLE